MGSKQIGQSSDVRRKRARCSTPTSAGVRTWSLPAILNNSLLALMSSIASLGTTTAKTSGQCLESQVSDSKEPSTLTCRIASDLAQASEKCEDRAPLLGGIPFFLQDFEADLDRVLDLFVNLPGLRVELDLVVVIGKWRQSDERLSIGALHILCTTQRRLVHEGLQISSVSINGSIGAEPHNTHGQKLGVLLFHQTPPLVGLVKRTTAMRDQHHRNHLQRANTHQRRRKAIIDPRSSGLLMIGVLRCTVRT
jgi:hypothetical protein